MKSSKVKDQSSREDQSSKRGQAGNRFRLLNFELLLFFELCALSFPAMAGPPAEPGSYQLHPALEMSLFAREPDVVDPVALTWDEEGRMYVVEMRDYPYGIGPERKPGGTVRLLEDTNNDGKADRAVVFAEELSFPTSIAPWNGGVLVTAPPEIIFLKDTDGDGKAEVREVLFKGFTLGVTDANVNGLRWGLDNRVHGCNGGNDGTVTSTRKPGAPVSIRNLDFSFDPKSGDFTPTYHTSGGFGKVFDAFGRSFATHNINHIQQQMIPVRYLKRFPGLPPVNTTESISDHEAMARIYPISEPETRPNHPEQSGHFSASGGLGFIGSRAYPDDLFGSVLVCDVVGNLVHRDVLSMSGPEYVASRSPTEKKSEFFASRDKSFRPIGIELGPDGALYLIDMQRDVIEHPDYIPKKLRDKIDIRAGEDRGRIYRITPKGGLSARKPSLRRAPTAELVNYLSSSNCWWRYTAQRLLVERDAKSAVPPLKKMVASADPLGRLHSLWTLEALGALDQELILRALADEHSSVRENALLLAERHLSGSEKFVEHIISIAHDRDARVRFQAALTIGQLDSASAVAALVRILSRDHGSRWTRLAVLSSIRSGEERVLDGLLVDVAFRSAVPGTEIDAVREVADLIGARAPAQPAKIAAVLALLTQDPRPYAPRRIAVVEGLQSGLARAGGLVSPDLTMASALVELSRRDLPLISLWKLSRTLGLPDNDAQRAALAQAMQWALDNSRPLTNRLDDIRLLSLGSYAQVGKTLFELLDGSQPGDLQRAAIDALRQFNELDVATNLVSRWRTLVPAVRPLVVNLLLQRVTFHPVLLEAIETERVKLGELNLDLEQRRRLLRRSTPEIQARAARLIGDEEYSNRKTIVGDWLNKLPPAGDASRGRAVFELTCAQCHLLDGVGHAVGPDLGSLAHRSVEDLLSNILDPNMAINPGYVAYSVETVSGEFETGLLQSESADAVQLLQASGRKVVIPRTQIKHLSSSGVSLMPEGVEGGLSPADLRDLIALLQLKR
jgi:putative membrane-bound dehydrogenase-like protein